ncbi:hypothetical protein EDF24_1442 [Curtobacterium sp. PhB130]|uniref:hypothetical protein n=1 Tax=Curtobacterium sp. PhB130 TaxID=2485178 RepID=UPI000F4B1AFD|nr:hypothetical protein [Curtobacterium sp. PhB130]ROS75869.1 hypothetical protein EDF24_1442 [Curtobacterium sp. PhB130]
MPAQRSTLDRIDQLLTDYDMNQERFYRAVFHALQRSGPPTLPPVPASVDPDDPDVVDAVDQIMSGAFQIYAAEDVASGVAGSLSQASTAKLLHLTVAQVEAMIGAKRILAVDIAGEPRVLRWQLNDGHPPQLLPGLQPVIEAIATTASAFGRVAGFMTTTQPTLRAPAALTPRHWLMNGGDPTAIVRLIEAWAHR